MVSKFTKFSNWVNEDQKVCPDFGNGVNILIVSFKRWKFFPARPPPFYLFPALILCLQVAYW